MTQEEKQLLIKDLCARLPYDVCAHVIYNTGEPCYGKLTPQDMQWFIDSKIEIVKPYLRPMSSMTEEELKMFKQLQVEADEAGTFEGDMLLYDWLNKNHFDYRLLIFQGLALEAPEGMYMSYDEKHPTTEDIIKKRDESIRKYGHFFKKKDE